MSLTRRTFLRRSAAGAALLGVGGVIGAPLVDARTRLTAAQLRALRSAVRGQVLAPGDRGYDAARVLFNKRFDGVRPPAVVRARDAEDVRAAVGWARRYDVGLVSRSGGHAYNGASTSGDAVVIDVGRLDRVALSGGGGSFGIVTAIRLRVRRVRTAAWFFASFPRPSAGEALAAWDELAPGAS